jgi:hypothetical protein
MNVFFVWGRDRSHKIAQGLKTLLATAAHGPSYFISDDVPSGQLWRYVLAEKLNETDFGIVCLTPENRNDRWLHFESGAIAKAVGKSNIIPYLFELSPTDLEQPLADFQCLRAIQSDTLKLALQIARLSENHSDDIVGRIFDKLAWGEMNSILDKLREKTNNSVLENNSNTNLRNDTSKLDEILSRVRRLENTVPDSKPKPDNTIKELFPHSYVVPYVKKGGKHNPVIKDMGNATGYTADGYKDGTVLLRTNSELPGLKKLTEAELQSEKRNRGIESSQSV